MNTVQDTLSQLSDQELSELLEVNSREYPEDTVHLARLEAYKRWGSILPRKSVGIIAIAEAKSRHVPDSPVTLPTAREATSLPVPRRSSARLMLLLSLFAASAFVLGLYWGKYHTRYAGPTAIVTPLPPMNILKHREERPAQQEDSADKRAASMSPQEIFDAYNQAVVLVCMVDGHGRRVGTVTGLNIAADGLIIVPSHALQAGVVSAEVIFPAHGTFDVAGVAGMSEDAVDLAFLKVSGSDFPVLPGRQAHSVGLEEKAFIIGNPQGLINTLLASTIRAIREMSGMKQYEIRMPPNASVADGSVVVNERGEMLGIVSGAICIPAEEIEAIRPFRKVVPLTGLESYLQSR